MTPTFEPGAWRARLFAAVLGVVALTLAALPRSALAIDIQRFTTPGGVHVWLVEESTVPLITVNFAWRGGAAQDDPERPGIANLLSAMLDEGAGEMDARGFQERMEALAMRMSFDAGRDAFFGEFRTLVETRDEAFDMLRLAVNEARFDSDALERMRERILTGIRDNEANPRNVMARTFANAVFGNHPYGRAVEGTADSVAAITADDLRAYVERVFARDNLTISVVGAIDEKTLTPLIDSVFGGLPNGARLAGIPDAIIPDKPFERSAELDVPQTVIQFGRIGMMRDDPDFIPAFVMNHILGGGAFSSRLYEEVREKRGLAYSVYSYLRPMDHSALILGGVATANPRAGEAIEVVREEIRRMAQEGPTEEELASAKAFLKGSYALRFDTGDKISGQLLMVQLEELGHEYFSNRNDLIEAVTIDDVRRAAERVLGDGEVFVITVGQPVAGSGG